MGHIVNPDREYRLLQKKLDRYITGAPDSPALMKILKILFSPEDAEFAKKIPFTITPLHVLARKLNMAQDALADKLSGLARRGLVFDIECNGEQYFTLTPVVIGFFELTFMRSKEDLPMAELAGLFEEYMEGDKQFAHAVFQGRTQIGRSLVNEEALPGGDHTEVLDWERASQIVASASTVGVSVCACRHKQSHLGHVCENNQHNCLSFNFAAESLIRNGFAQAVTKDKAMQILAQAKEAGLAQTGDNVQRKVAYICNCCGCCCGMVQAIKVFDMPGAIVTSNWIAKIDLDCCKGCGRCEKACPVDALAVEQESGDREKQGRAIIDQTLCLGCGVCYAACKFGAISMKPRAKRVYTPETIFDRVVAMAIERGKLADLLFEEPVKLSHRALSRIIGIVEKSSPYKAVMAIEPLRSAFLKALVAGAKKASKEVSGLVS